MTNNNSNISEPYRTLIQEMIGENRGWYEFKLKDSPTGQKLMGLQLQEQAAFVVAAVEWLGADPVQGHDYERWAVRSAIRALLNRQLPFAAGERLMLLDWAVRQHSNHWRNIPQMIKVVEGYLSGSGPTPEILERIQNLIAAISSEAGSVETRQWIIKLQELGGLEKQDLPIVAGEAWSDAALGDLEAMDETQRAAWYSLLQICMKASSGSPSAKWLKEATPLFEAVGFPQFKQAVLHWFPLVDKPRPQIIETWPQYHPNPNYAIADANADILKGVVWLCAAKEDKEIARALTVLAVAGYRSIVGFGQRCIRVGNACVWALGNMPGNEGVGQLALLKLKVKFGSAQKAIESALSKAAARLGLPQEEIEEMSVPTYGLQEVGLGRETLGEFVAELAVTGTSAAELRWIKADGKRQASVPQSVKAQFKDELKEAAQVVKDIKKMLPAQRDRIENLYLEQKTWPLPLWRERYLNHPLIGTLARRMIWQFTCGETSASGIRYENRLIGHDGKELDWLNDSARVELWHPIHEPVSDVVAWRDWLAFHEIQQPFKQAHREIYLLTDAERTTHVYSNRFAAHIIKQHQFNALCGVRGWKNKLRLMVDDSCPPAMRIMKPWGLRAEFWIEGIGDNYGQDTTEAGSFLYLATDQVRFYPIDAPMNSAHASGGGYGGGAYGQEPPAVPLDVEQIPPLVFSEIMRDVDLFVGVASVANDPNWSDGGPQGNYRTYWNSYSFGELSETAKTRKQVLERLVPKLKIADRCHFTDKFLVVRGDLRTYKIHLGSGNILMEPNDQYLCIVRAAGDGFGGKVFLPFEGDTTLAVILSKAFLLATDQTIKDETILRQIFA